MFGQKYVPNLIFNLKVLMYFNKMRYIIKKYFKSNKALKSNVKSKSP